MPGRNPIKTALLAACAAGASLALGLLRLGWHIAVAYLAGASLATLLVYGYDKRQARAGGFRVPEAWLHWMALGGGTPGALLGRPLFRHKTRKTSFRLTFWLIVALQAAAVVGYEFWTRRP